MPVRVRLTVVRLSACLCLVLSLAACGLIIKDPIALMGNVNAPSTRMLSRDDALTDIETVIRTLEHAHANPYPTPAPAPAGPAVPVKELRTAFFNYRVIQPGVAYMDFFTIVDGLDTEATFRKATDAMFKKVAADQPRVLIIDIRENGGGEDNASAALLQHITEKPFRLLAYSQVKRSKEVREFGSSMLRIPFRWMGLQYLSSEARQYYTGDLGSLAPPVNRPVETRKPAQPFFSGPVCVLTGPRTASPAVELAEEVKTCGLATIVGEETGG